MLSFYYNIKKGNNLKNENNQLQETKCGLKKMVQWIKGPENRQHLGRAVT